METFKQEALHLCETDNTPSASPDKLSLPSQEPGWSWLLLLAAISTTVGSAIPYGYNIGVINTPSSVIKQWCNASLALPELTDTQLELVWSTIVSVFIVGGIIGSLAASWCADYVGRKGAVIISDVLSVVSALMFYFCKPLSSVSLLLFARFIVGLASGLTLSVMPMYLMELAPDTKRGAVAVLTTFGVTFGVLIGQFMSLDWLLGTASSWHILLSLYLVLVLASMMALPVIPESPKYLYSVWGDKLLALKELSRLRGCSVEEVARELEGVPVDHPWTVLSVLSTPRMGLPLALVCALQAGQQFSGINAVFFYSSYIFKSVGLNDTECQYATLGAGAINFGISVIMIPVVNCCRRRPLLQLSCGLVTITLVLLAISISFMLLFIPLNTIWQFTAVGIACKKTMGVCKLPIKNTITWMGYIAVSCVLMYVLVYGFGLGPIPYFIGSELFEVGPRPAAMALGSAANWLGNLFVGLTFPTLDRFIGQYAFLLFAASTMAILVFISLKLPETFNQHDNGRTARSKREGKLMGRQVGQPD